MAILKVKLYIKARVIGVSGPSPVLWANYKLHAITLLLLMQWQGMSRNAGDDVIRLSIAIQSHIYITDTISGRQQ